MLACPLYPLAHNARQSLYYFIAEKHLINIAHMKHINHAAKVGAALGPPSQIIVHHQIVKDIDLFMRLKFLKFHSVKQRLVYTVCYSTSECCGVVVLLNLPYRDGIDGACKRAINAASQSA